MIWKQPVIRMLMNGKPISSGKSIIGKPHHIDMFWDRHIRMWTLTVMDKNGFQIDNARYEANKTLALRHKADLEKEYKITSKKTGRKK